MTKDEALKLALEALEGADMIDCDMREAITALREALAEQPAQQDSTCNNTLRAQGKAYPRTCKKCGLGPCVGLAQQALDKKAENARELGLDYEPVQQEPVAWEQFYPDIGKPQIAEALAKEKALQDLHDENERLGLYKDAYAEQEPVAWISTGPARMIHWTSDKPAYGDDWVPLYTTPPQRMAKRIEDLETEQDCVGWFGYDAGLRLWFETNKGDDGAIPLYKRRRTHD